MGIKSTRILTREECIRTISFRLETFVETELNKLSDTELEDLLEKLDELSGDIFTNYLIKG